MDGWRWPSCFTQEFICLSVASQRWQHLWESPKSLYIVSCRWNHSMQTSKIIFMPSFYGILKQQHFCLFLCTIPFTLLVQTQFSEKLRSHKLHSQLLFKSRWHPCALEKPLQDTPSSRIISTWHQNLPSHTNSAEHRLPIPFPLPSATHLWLKKPLQLQMLSRNCYKSLLRDGHIKKIHSWGELQLKIPNPHTHSSEKMLSDVTSQR